MAGTGISAAQAQTPARPKLRMLGMRVQLLKDLDTRTAKIGEPVLARPQANIRTPDGFEVDDHATLVGRVLGVEPSTDHGPAEISIAFDRIEPRHGQPYPVHVTVLWIAPPPSELHPSTTSAPADRTTPGVGVDAGQTGAPAAQGFANSDVTGAPNIPMDQPVGPTRTPGVFSQRDGIPGIDLHSDIRDTASGVFDSKNRNVNLPGGTVMAVAVWAPMH